MDTTKDIRITWLERIIDALSQQVERRSFGSLKRSPQVQRSLQEMRGLIPRFKYSYLDAADLKAMPEQETLRALAREALEPLVERSQGQRDSLAVLRFYRHCLERFRPSFDEPPSLERCVAVEVGRVETTTKHPKARKLLLCHVAVFGERLEIVTNLLTDPPWQDDVPVFRAD